MRMIHPTNHATIEAFFANRFGMGGNPKRSLMFQDGVLYSYGVHWPLARLSPDDPEIVYINMDRCSRTTNRHATNVRGMARSLGMQTVEMPEAMKTDI